MRESLILITGLYRCDNLFALSQSVIEEANKYKDKFDIYWLICLDQYNGFGDISKGIDNLYKSNINWQIRPTGKPNQNNYGGDLFNEPLIAFVDEFKINNPWVYVLDDDNIIHPRLLYIFDKCLDNNFFNNKEIITTINKWNTGHNREIDLFLLKYTNDSNTRLEWFLFDPSQVILRYSIIERYGFYKNDLLYDLYWLNYPMIYTEVDNDNVIFYNDYDGGFGKHIVSSYHNGLIQLNQIDNFNNEQLQDINCDVLLQSNNIDTPLNIPILKEETKRKILELITQDYKQLYDTN